MLAERREEKNNSAACKIKNNGSTAGFRAAMTTLRIHFGEDQMSYILRAFIQNEAALRRYLAQFFSHQSDIDDMLQEVFAHAFHAETKTKIRAPKAYLYRAAKNLSLNALARKSFTTTDHIEDIGAPLVLKDTGQAATDDLLADRQHLLLAMQAILALPSQCQKAFVLRKIEGHSYKEIASIMGISESTVEKHIASGLARCVSILRKQGIDYMEFFSTNQNAKTKRGLPRNR